MRNGIIASLVLVSTLSGCGNATSNMNAANQTAAKASPQVPDTKAGSALAGGLLQPISDSWWQSVNTETVLNSQGKAVTLPVNHPLIFMAYWCKYCHNALQQLKQNNELDKFNYVSMYLTGSEPGGKPASVSGFQDAVKLTQQSLASRGISIPADHIFYAMPDSSLNTKVNGVPTILEKTDKGWYVLNGATNSPTWTSILQYSIQS